MHSLLTAFFACLFGFNHTAAQPATPPATAETHVIVVSEHMPTRYDLAQSRTHSVYAEGGCVSCRRTDVSYRTR